MTFDNPLLRAAFEENKGHLEERLKRLEEVNRDIEQIEENLKSLSTPPGGKKFDELGLIKWDGSRLKLNKSNLMQCTPENKIKASPFLIEFLTFILKGGL